MAKLESSFKNMLLSLFGITLIASASLGLVNDATRSAITNTEQKKQTSAIAAVLPNFASLGESYKLMPKDGKDSITVFPALNEAGQPIGFAVKTYTYKGFSGYVEIMSGFDSEGNITGYQVLKHAETPGLGDKMNKWFRPQTKVRKSIVETIFGFEVKTFERQSSVIQKNPIKNRLAVKQDGGEIDAITAATISSRAFLDAINRAYSTISENQMNPKETTNEKGE